MQLVWDYRLYVAVYTTDDTRKPIDRMVAQSQANWKFVGSGWLGANYIWVPNGAKVTTTHAWGPVVNQPVLNTDQFNSVLHKAQWKRV